MSPNSSNMHFFWTVGGKDRPWGTCKPGTHTDTQYCSLAMPRTGSVQCESCQQVNISPMRLSNASPALLDRRGYFFCTSVGSWDKFAVRSTRCAKFSPEAKSPHYLCQTARSLKFLFHIQLWTRLPVKRAFQSESDSSSCWLLAFPPPSSSLFSVKLTKLYQLPL